MTFVGYGTEMAFDKFVKMQDSQESGISESTNICWGVGRLLAGHSHHNRHSGRLCDLVIIGNRNIYL